MVHGCSAVGVSARQREISEIETEKEGEKKTQEGGRKTKTNRERNEGGEKAHKEKEGGRWCMRCASFLREMKIEVALREVKSEQ